MNISKNKGLIYSDYIVDMLSYRFSDIEGISASVETFYNCREMGYVLLISDESWEKEICIWIYGQRNSDNPTITWEETGIPHEVGNMFSEDSYRNRTEIFENVDEAFEKVVKIIEDKFGI